MTIGALNSYGNIQQYPCTGKDNLQKINQKPKPKKKEWSTRKKITTGLALLAFSAAFGIPLYLAIKKPNRQKIKHWMLPVKLLKILVFALLAKSCLFFQHFL